MRIIPCPHCGLYIDIPSDHARTCPKYQGRACTHPEATSIDSDPQVEDALYWWCPDCSASGVL